MIKWIRRFVEKDAIIIKVINKTINGLLVNANIDGTPIMRTNDPIFWSKFVFLINDILKFSNFEFSLSCMACPISWTITAKLVILFLLYILSEILISFFQDHNDNFQLVSL